MFQRRVQATGNELASPIVKVEGSVGDDPIIHSVYRTGLSVEGVAEAKFLEFSACFFISIYVVCYFV